MLHEICPHWALTLPGSSRRPRCGSVSLAGCWSMAAMRNTMSASHSLGHVAYLCGGVRLPDRRMDQSMRVCI